VTELQVREGVRVIAAFCISALPLDEAALAQAAAERLARYKQPRAWIRVETLPRNANGKLRRRALQDHALS
jgi:acyl-coenzyme A synthetase/AMP-(fatty) acid ligase